MGPTFGPCQDCGGEQLFEHPHATPGSCPDVPDGMCPELCCTQCGAALFDLALPGPFRTAVPAYGAGRVA